MSSYVVDVFKWGIQSEKEIRAWTGNLRHRDKFGPHDLKTDGAGNVIDQPLLRKKACFGRVEIYLRRNLYQVRYNLDRSGFERPSYTPCMGCPVRPACEHLVGERLESHPKIEAAFIEMDTAFPKLCGKTPSGQIIWGARCYRPWGKLLHALKAHGHWTSVNDARVRSDAALRVEERAEANRQAARKSRAKQRARYLGNAAPGEITEEFLQEVTSEHQQRLGVLLDLRTQKASPRWITRLSEEGCARTVDVWQAQLILRRQGKKPTGNAVAHLLTLEGKHRGLAIASLTSLTCKDIRRIKLLEKECDGQSIWLPFTPGR